MKTHIVICLYEILKIMDEEITKCLDVILDIFTDVDFNSNEKLVGLVQELHEKIKKKYLTQIGVNASDAQETMKVIKSCVNKYFEKKDYNIKMWVLAWFFEFITVDGVDLVNSIWVHVVDLVNVLDRYSNSEIMAETKRLIDLTLYKFNRLDSQANKQVCLQICRELLENHENSKLSVNQQVISLKWLISLLELIFKDVDELEEFEENVEVFEQIFLKSIVIIIDNKSTNHESVNQLISELNSCFLENLENANKVFQTSPENKFQSILCLLIDRLRTANSGNINLLFDWIEKIFVMNPEDIKQHASNIAKILDNDNTINLNQIMKFITRLISNLNNFVIIPYIVQFYALHKKKDWKVTEFIDFMKIVMTKTEDIILFACVLEELLKIKDRLFVMKVIESFQALYVNDKSFTFLRKFIKRVKTENIAVQEKEYFRIIMETWACHPISMFSLCIASGKYKMAHYIILKIAQDEIKKMDIEQFQLFVEMLELPYFSYIRIDLLKFNE